MGHRRFHDKYFDRGLRGWINNTARKHHWRVASYIDLDDLIQEGLLAYCICRNRYRDRVQNRRHFMALVQVVYLNRITDLANERSKGEDVPVSQIAAEGKELLALEYLAGGCHGDAELQATLASAPSDVRRLLDLYNDPKARADMDKPLRRRTDGTRETSTERLCTILGIPYVDFDVLFQTLLGVAP